MSRSSGRKWPAGKLGTGLEGMGPSPDSSWITKAKVRKWVCFSPMIVFFRIFSVCSELWGNIFEVITAYVQY